LKALFAEFDRIAPSRDHASDGSIGDAAHRQEVSDHNPDETGKVPIHDADKTNEVHAIDVDDDLRESDLTMEKVVQFLLGRCRSGAEERLRYIIYNRRIWSASSGWVQKAYTGASAHTEHAHFSASYDSKLEASTASWHLEEIPVALNQADKDWIKSTVTAAIAASVDDHLKVSGWSSGYTGRTEAMHMDDMQSARNYAIGNPDAKGQQISEDAPMALWTKAAKIIIEAAPDVHTS
jgi:hypothetical protein